jgi:hypothetical protein
MTMTRSHVTDGGKVIDLDVARCLREDRIQAALDEAAARVADAIITDLLARGTTRLSWVDERITAPWHRAQISGLCRAPDS